MHVVTNYRFLRSLVIQKTAHGCHQHIPPGSIIPWVPKPNKFFSESFTVNDDTWVVCDGVTTCKKGMFAGQACSDLSDRALIGDGQTGVLLDLKDASFPDHEHKHKHFGTQTYPISYRRGPLDTQDKGGIWNGETVARHHDHNELAFTSVTVNFGDMTEEYCPVTNIMSPKISLSTNENELYSPHIRVKFMFKCI